MALMEIEQDGIRRKMSDTFFRGDTTNFYPQDLSLERADVLPEYIVKGWMPERPFLDKTSAIVAFGSCFATAIRWLLTKKGYNIMTEKAGKAYITKMGDGMVNTFAILQQFEWAWENKVPKADLWHGYSAQSFGYDEAVRIETKALFDAAECFIITLGLSEIWYDEPTGEVFWRAVPKGMYDPTRHKFRVSTFEENYRNLTEIVRLIRRYRPDASIVLTLSPVPLAATFRPVACLTANSVSKAILRAAVDQLYRDQLAQDGKIYYFPSYEVVTSLYHHPWMEDRRHVYPHVLDFNMITFEHYFCLSGVTEAEVLASFRRSQELDRKIGREGHLPKDKEAEQMREHRRQARIMARRNLGQSRLLEVANV